MIDGGTDIGDGTCPEAEPLRERAAVADPRQIHAQRGMAGLGQAPRKPDMQPVRPDAVDHTGVHQQHRWRAAWHGRCTGDCEKCAMLPQPQYLLGNAGIVAG